MKKKLGLPIVWCFIVTNAFLFHCVSAAPVLNKKIFEFNSALRIQEEFLILDEGGITDSDFELHELRIQLNPDKSYDNIALYDKVYTQYGQAVAYNTLDRRWVKFKGNILYFADEADGTNKVEVIPFRVLNPRGELSEWGEIRISLDGSFDQNYDVLPSDDQAQVTSGESVIIDVKANDIGAKSYYAIEAYRSPKHGSAEINSNNAITYTPNPDFIGTDSFKYRLKGNNLYKITSGVATVNIEIQKQLLPPSNSIDYDGVSSSFTVNWTKANNEDISYYQLEERLDDNNWVINYSGLGLYKTISKNPGTYYYRVKVCNNSSCSTYSNISSISVPDNTVGIPNISNDYSNAGGMYTVMWEASTANTPHEYHLQENKNDTSWNTVFSGNATSMQFTNYDGKYDYRVKACNQYSCSDYSNKSTVLIVNNTSVQECPAVLNE